MILAGVRDFRLIKWRLFKYCLFSDVTPCVLVGLDQWVSEEYSAAIFRVEDLVEIGERVLIQE